MGLTLREETLNHELVPHGAHVARCFKIVDLGTQRGDYMGKETIHPKLVIAWELPKATRQDGQVFTIQKKYTASLNEKATLRRDLESWRGRVFNDEELACFKLDRLLGHPAMLNIIHREGQNGTMYAQVASISPLPQGYEPPPALHQPVYFDLDHFNPQTFEALPDRLKEIIALSPEYRAATGPRPAMAGPVHGEEVPF